MSYKDQTFFGSENCQNKCGRKISKQERQEAFQKDYLVCYAYFCDEGGEIIHYDRLYKNI